MIRKIIAATILLVASSMAAYAATTGWQRSIKVEWEYAQPENVTVSKFRLYQNVKKV